MDIYINNYYETLRVDTDENTKVVISLSVASIANPSQESSSSVKPIVIPATPNNRLIFGDCEQPNTSSTFNMNPYPVYIEEAGSVIAEGFVQLLSYTSAGAGAYTFGVLCIGNYWVSMISRTRLASLFPQWNLILGAAAVRDSWTNPATPVRFLPVQRGEYVPQNPSGSVIPAERVLSMADYHPFIHLRKLVENIFASAGYTVESEFLKSDFFESLYMSGNYPARDVAAMRTRMDFVATRLAPKSAVANSVGVVYADPDITSNSVGNIVDSADPNLGHFRMDGGVAHFVPDYEVSVAFEYRLVYQTQYRMLSPTRLAGFDTLSLGGGVVQEFILSNRFPSRKTQFIAGNSFRCVVFGDGTSQSYRLMANRTSGALTMTALISEFTTTSSALVSTARPATYSDLRLMIKNGTVWVDYTGEWELYDGSVNTTGYTDVDITLRSPMETLTPGTPKYFNELSFGGADAGMSMIIREAQVRPVFNPHPGINRRVLFGQVAAHDVSNMQVINALVQMFDLYFYTDATSYTVHIEPRSTFYRDDVDVDWSDRLDASHPMEMKELNTDFVPTYTFGYRSGDEAVARRNITQGGRLGEWTKHTNSLSLFARTKNSENPLFTPSLNTQGVISSAPSASLVQAADRAQSGDIYVDELNFLPKVVVYEGMTTLPTGETWGWPGGGNKYPAAYFHKPQIGTLCFENRDSVIGLRRYREEFFKTYSQGRRLTAWFRLGPDDIEALLHPTDGGHDFRARYKLRIGGEWSYWRLEEVCDYDPQAPSTKCVLTQVVV